MRTSVLKWHHIAVLVVNLMLFPMFINCDSDTINIFVQTYENRFNPDLKDEEKCKELTKACLTFRRILGCGFLCKRINDEPVNPCRQFVEPCFGIPLDVYLDMRKFNDNDYESY